MGIMESSASEYIKVWYFERDGLFGKSAESLMAKTITNIKLPGFLNGATNSQTDDYAVIAFTGIDTADDVVTVFAAAGRLGAKRGIVFTGKVVDDHLLAMYLRCAATISGVDDVNPASGDFIILCTHLNSLVRRDDAECAPDLLSGGFKFSDEVPADIEKLGENLMPLVNLL